MKPTAPEAAKRENVRQWTLDPAGAELAYGLEPDTLPYFEEVERTRYEFYPWLRTEYLESRFWQAKNVLEIGTGLGTDHLQLARAGARLTGVDLTPASIEHTGRRFELYQKQSNLQVADAEQLPFPDRSFDAVYSFGVIMCTPDMARAATEVLRVLRPGGRGLIAIYSRRSYFYAWRLFRHFIRGDWRSKSLHDMRAEFEFGSGTPLVRVVSKKDAAALFGSAAVVSVEARHLPTNRLPSGWRHRADAMLKPIERQFGWYWMIDLWK